MEDLAQLLILLLGALSIALLAFDNKAGFVVGLAVQPFWFYTSWNHGQWGVFIVGFVYTASYLAGIYRWKFPAIEGKTDHAQ